jgi:hypothetical protein
MLSQDRMLNVIVAGACLLGVTTLARGAGPGTIVRLVAFPRDRGIAVDASSIPGARHRWSDWRAATAGVLESLTR